jgi:hypothetical protein
VNHITVISRSGLTRYTVAMEAIELRARAEAELRELGTEPTASSGRQLWREERRGATVLLAGLAGWQGPLLRRAAVGLPGAVADPVRELLHDAACLADEEF